MYCTVGAAIYCFWICKKIDCLRTTVSAVWGAGPMIHCSSHFFPIEENLKGGGARIEFEFRPFSLTSGSVDNGAPTQPKGMKGEGLPNSQSGHTS